MTTLKLSNHFLHEVMDAKVTFSTDVFKIILLNSSFVFDEDIHTKLADVTASQLATANGYTQDDYTLTTGTLTEDDVNNRGHMTWDDVLWTAAGGNIGPTAAAIIYDDTNAEDIIVGCIGFGTSYTIETGGKLEIKSISVSLGQA